MTAAYPTPTPPPHNGDTVTTTPSLGHIAWNSLPQALAKLDPRYTIKTPVLFVVWVGSVLTTIFTALDPNTFSICVTAWLWATLIFANLAEAIAEGRGKAQAASLRATKTTTTALLLNPDGTTTQTPSTALTIGDHVIVEPGPHSVIPADGDIIEGVATVDESAITGESAPVIRESGGDRCAVTGGTTVLSDRIIVRVTSKPGESFIDRMIALVEGAQRQKTPNEIALGILLTTLTVIFLLAVTALAPLAAYSGLTVSVITLVALLVCLIPTTIGALLSAIGIAGMDRLVQRNVLATSGRAVEAAGDVSTLLLDKTGTITFGNRRAVEILPATAVSDEDVRAAALLSSLADETPEGRSIIDLINSNTANTADHARTNATNNGAEFIPFTAQTRMSGVQFPDGRAVYKGAANAITAWVRATADTIPDNLETTANTISAAGGTPLVIATQTPHNNTHHRRILGVIHLKDIVKPGMRERFEQLRRMGIRTVMITGDNHLTAQAIAKEAGVDDFLAEATPEDKLALITKEQHAGQLVAMTGDGTNDAPTLAQADVGVAMNTGTSAAKEAGNMVDLDSDPTKLIDIVSIGKQLLITRGALTTFSIANDVAKYFAIIPAMFTSVYPGLAVLDIMHLHSAHTAMLSAVIFNALIIVALIPLALKGVTYRALNAQALLRRNITLYGIGGIITPFIGIKLIDLLVSQLPGLA